MTSRRITIFLGTAPQPFPSIIAWADARQTANPDEVITVQYGASEAPQVATGIDYVPPQELGALAAAADITITHGGPGTIMDVRAAGHRPIVLPRNPARSEMVDDHQMRFTAWAASKDLIHRAVEPDEIDTFIAELGTTREETSDTSHSTVETAERLERIIAGFDRSRLPSADDATSVLLLTGDRAERQQLQQQLSERDDVALLGSTSSLLLAADTATPTCSCGATATDCPFWTTVVADAFGGWGGIDSAELRRTATWLTTPRAIATISRRRPSTETRHRLITFSDTFRRLYDAVARQVTAPLLVDSTSVAALGVALSHNRQLDLRVADLGSHDVQSRLLHRAAAYRRVPTARVAPGALSNDPGSASTALAPLFITSPARTAATPGAATHHMLDDLEPQP